MVAITGVAAPAIAGYCLSSIGITIRVLVDIKKHRTRTAKIVLGAAVLDDIIGVVILATLYDFAIKGEISLIDTGTIIGFVPMFQRNPSTSHYIRAFDMQSYVPSSLFVREVLSGY